MIDSYELESARSFSPNSIASSMEISGAKCWRVECAVFGFLKQLPGC